MYKNNGYDGPLDEKIIQIISNEHAFYGLSSEGNLYERFYDFNNKQIIWKAVPITFEGNT